MKPITRINKMITPFGAKINKELPLNEYPRPLMQKTSWQNLNGIWEYAIYPTGTPFAGYEGEIVVPFSPESYLSGVEKIIMPDDTLYYKKTFDFKRENDTVLLHFGAVDYACVVRLNGRIIGQHKGGYFPFTFDISKLVQEGQNTLEVSVTDPTDEGLQSRGKQKIKRGGIWYTPQSGIWQTVWIEQVCENYVKEIHYETDINEETVRIDLDFERAKEGFMVDIIMRDGGKIRMYTDDATATIDLTRAFHLWSPEDPYLYTVKITTSSGEQITSYFAMRKVSVKRVGEFYRICLNGKPYFQKGLLDQGYWSDGLYTAPSDEAMIYDIQTMKDLGFNTLRKHIKVEPLRWYYHCDRLGMLVWQDLVSSGVVDPPIKKKYSVRHEGYEKRTGLKKDIPVDNDYVLFGREDEENRAEYYEDLYSTVTLLKNQPCIVLWTAFNECWGQFDALRAVKVIQELDKTRLVDHASGWYDQGGGDVNSIHNYRKKPWYPLFNKQDKRPIVLSEYGGLTAMPTVEHIYDPLKSCGYRRFRNAESCTKAFCKLQKRIANDIEKKGLSACIYTQVSDVEEEMNGLLTYDRKVVKVDVKKVKAVNQLLHL